MNLYLYNYNNYFNRIAKRETKLDDYGTPLDVFVGVNFIIGDGLRTTQIVNSFSDTPNYLIVAESLPGVNVIRSRWFVLKSTQLRNGQYHLELMRDVIADWWDDIVEAPMFMEKGYVSISDAAIYSPENVAVSQVKTKETLIKDATESAWVVGYYAPPTEEEANTTEILYGTADPAVDYATPSLEDWYYTNWTSTIDDEKVYPNNGIQVAKEIKYGLFSEYSDNQMYKIICDKESVLSTEKKYVNQVNTGLSIDIYNIDTAISYTVPAIPVLMQGEVLSTYGLALDKNSEVSDGVSYNSLNRMAGRILKVGSGDNTEYYRIGIIGTSRTYKPEIAHKSALNNRYVQWAQNVNTLSGKNVYSVSDFGIFSSGCYLEYTTWELALTLKKFTPNTGLKFNIHKTRRQLADAPYCMFCMPYGDNYRFKATDVNFLTNKSNAIQIAAGFFTSAGANVYDIQILPFCPIPRIRQQGTTADMRYFSDWQQNRDYVIIPGANQVIFWCSNSSGSFDIPYTYTLNTTDSPNFKTASICDFVRLCSPNFNGMFDFNPYKSNGFYNLNVDFQYKPFQPYIHINPNFGKLYGDDYNDPRGLILGGDFSLTSTSNAWTDYQIANKNYQVMFDRQIENLGVQHEVARAQEGWAIGIGAVQGTITGSMAGGNFGPWGAAIGGALGFGSSVAGGIADYQLNEKLRSEQIAYTKDQFGFQMENIKAMPNSITKVSSINPNNKIFPIVEEYSAYLEEKDAVLEKLYYNGMSINRIGKLSDFIPYKPTSLEYGYFKGRLIRLADLEIDFNISTQIANELNQGVYI